MLAVFLCVSCDHTEHKASYTVARNTNWEQTPLYGEEKNMLGFSDDLIYEIAKKEAFTVKLISYLQGPLIQALNIKGIDAVLTTMQPTHERLKYYVFSQPYFTIGPVLLVRKNATATNLSDLTDHSIAYDRLTTWPLSLPGASGCVFHAYDDMLQAVDDLSRGKIDAVVLDAIIANNLAAGLYSNSIKVSGPPLVPLGFYLVVKKGKNEELISLFNKALQKLKKDGLYPKMLLYWGLFDALIVDST